MVTRAPGVVYTPREVCEPMVRRALEPLVRGKSRDELLALRVCDPAIGEGAFLIEIVRMLGDLVVVDRAGLGQARGQVAVGDAHGGGLGVAQRPGEGVGQPRRDRRTHHEGDPTADEEPADGRPRRP